MKYSFCPKCGSTLKITRHGKQLVPICTKVSCGLIFWQNSKPAVAVLIKNQDGYLLLTIRGIKPEFGKLDFPGGFLHEFEKPAEGAKREIKEELGISVNIGETLGFSLDTYGQEEYPVLVIGLLASVTAGTLKAQDEITDILWVDPKTVDPAQCAFPSTREFLKMWLNRNSL